MILFEIFLLNLFIQISLQEADYVIIMETMESIPGNPVTEVDFTKWKIVRKKKAYVLSGQYSQKVDMDNSYSIGITSAYSPMGNSHFIMHPFKVNKKPMCVFYNTTYTKYLMSAFKNHSNIPHIPPEGLCPFPKGEYWCKDVTLQTDNLPDHMLRGLWRMEEVFYKGNQVVGGLRLFVKIVDKIN